MLLFSLALNLQSIITLHSMEDTPSIIESLKELSLGSEQKTITTLLDKHINKVIEVMNQKLEIRNFLSYGIAQLQKESASAEFEWLPGYIVKLNPTDRLNGAKILKDIITINNLNLITIAEEWTYQIPEENYPETELRTLCISKKITKKPYVKITIEQIKQLVALTANTAYGPFRKENLISYQDLEGIDKIAIVETDNSSPWNFPATGIGLMYYRDSYLRNGLMTNEAGNYLHNYIWDNVPRVRLIIGQKNYN